MGRGVPPLQPHLPLLSSRRLLDTVACSHAWLLTPHLSWGALACARAAGLGQACRAAATSLARGRGSLKITI